MKQSTKLSTKKASTKMRVAKAQALLSALALFSSAALLTHAAYAAPLDAGSIVFYDKKNRVADATLAQNSTKTLGGDTVQVVLGAKEKRAGLDVVAVTISVTKASGEVTRSFKGVLSRSSWEDTYQGALKGDTGTASVVAVSESSSSTGNADGDAARQGAPSNGASNSKLGAGPAGGPPAMSNGKGSSGKGNANGQGSSHNSGGAANGSDDNDGSFNASVMPLRDHIVRLCGTDFVKLGNGEPLFDQLSAFLEGDAAKRREFSELYAEVVKANGEKAFSANQAVLTRSLSALQSLPRFFNDFVSRVRSSQDPQLSPITKASAAALAGRAFALLQTELVLFIDNSAPSGALAGQASQGEQVTDLLKVLGYTGGIDGEWLVNPNDSSYNLTLNEVLASSDTPMDRKRQTIAAVFAIWFGATMNSQEQQERFHALAQRYLDTVTGDAKPNLLDMQRWVKETLKLVAPRFTQGADSTWNASRVVCLKNLTEADKAFITYLKDEFIDGDLALLLNKYGEAAPDLVGLAKALLSYKADGQESMAIFVRLARSLSGANGKIGELPIHAWVTRFFATNEALCTEEAGDTQQDATAADAALGLIHGFLG